MARALPWLLLLPSLGLNVALLVKRSANARVQGNAGRSDAIGNVDVNVNNLRSLEPGLDPEQFLQAPLYIDLSRERRFPKICHPL